MTDNCESHAPTFHPLASLPLVERLRAIASCLPCDEPRVRQLVDPGAPVCQLLNQVADSMADVIAERDELKEALANLADLGAMLKLASERDRDPYYVVGDFLDWAVDLNPALRLPQGMTITTLARKYRDEVLAPVNRESPGQMP